MWQVAECSGSRTPGAILGALCDYQRQPRCQRGRLDRAGAKLPWRCYRCLVLTPQVTSEARIARNHRSTRETEPIARKAKPNHDGGPIGHQTANCRELPKVGRVTPPR